MTKKKLAAVSHIIDRCRSFDAMLAGEIPARDGVALTDGQILIYNNATLGLPACKSIDATEIGQKLLGILKEALSAELKPIEHPFRLEKVASTLSKRCREISTVNKYKKSYVTFEGATFRTEQVIDIFCAVGKDVCGFIAQSDGVFGGIQYLVVKPKDPETDLCSAGILLQSGESGLFQDTVLGRMDKVKKAIERIRSFEPEEGYHVAFSGGKDSQCVYHLAKMAGVKFDAHYSVTTVDPPELLKFIRKNYKDVIWDYPYDKDGKRTSMFKLIADHNIPPTRHARYCCEQLKEIQGAGRLVLTGVRWAESNNRKQSHGVVDIRTRSKRLIGDMLDNNPAATVNKHNSPILMDDNDESKRVVEHCYVQKRTTLNPIIDWDDSDVWEFLNDVAQVPHCSLYDEGHTRIGCVGCPLQGRNGMIKDFERWPQYKEMYIRAFEKMIENHPGEIKVLNQEVSPGDVNHTPPPTPQTREWAEEWMRWWVQKAT